jgi:hypothetical protein
MKLVRERGTCRPRFPPVIASGNDERVARVGIRRQKQAVFEHASFSMKTRFQAVTTPLRARVRAVHPRGGTGEGGIEARLEVVIVARVAVGCLELQLYAARSAPSAARLALSGRWRRRNHAISTPFGMGSLLSFGQCSGRYSDGSAGLTTRSQTSLSRLPPLAASSRGVAAHDRQYVLPSTHPCVTAREPRSVASESTPVSRSRAQGSAPRSHHAR